MSRQWFEWGLSRGRGRGGVTLLARKLRLTTPGAVFGPWRSTAPKYSGEYGPPALRPKSFGATVVEGCCFTGTPPAAPAGAPLASPPPLASTPPLASPGWVGVGVGVGVRVRVRVGVGVRVRVRVRVRALTPDRVQSAIDA